MKIIITSFDIGFRNFAFCTQEIDVDEIVNISNTHKVKPSFNVDGTCTDEYKKYLEYIYRTGKIIECQNIDIKYYSTSISDNYCLILTDVLNKYSDLWDKTNVFLIEQQMSYGRNKSNIQALKLAQHCQSYFYTIYGTFKLVIEYPSQNKTRMLGCSLVLRKTHASRKIFSVNLCKEILKLKNMDTLFDRFKKKDDISDCLLMIETFKLKLF